MARFQQTEDDAGGGGAPPAETPVPEAAPSAPPVTPPGARGSSALAAMGVDDSLAGLLDDARVSHRELSHAALEELGDLSDQRREVMERPVDRPEVPDLGTSPEEPPQTMPANGLRVYGQFLPVLAMLGGAFAQRDATAALRTASAAMRAARSNDQTNLELQHQHWEDQMTRLLSDRKAMLDQYQAALSDTTLDMNSRLSLLNAIAAQENNIQLRTRVSMGDLEGIAQQVNTQIRAVEALRTQVRADAALNEQGRHNREIEAARGGAGGQLAGAEQRGRITMSLPNVMSSLRTMDEVQTARRDNPLNANWGAEVLQNVPGMGGVGRTWGASDGDAEYQRYSQAVATLEQSFVPMFAGSATTESEARRYVRANAPQVFDTYEVVQAKMQNLQRLANQASIIIGQEPPFPDAGYLDPRQAAALTPPPAAAATPDAGGSPLAGIDQGALDRLVEHPEFATQFDEHFQLEPGTAQEYLDGLGTEQ